MIRLSHGFVFVKMIAAEGPGIALHALPTGLRAAILAHGGQAKEPWAWEGTRFCECTDPEGNVVQIFTR